MNLFKMIRIFIAKGCCSLWYFLQGWFFSVNNVYEILEQSSLQKKY